ncbi:unnamed protein product [Peronospora belbahrii]|uniref:HTH CENPB-type domain-containing protein n=1 Tax=Peronospora belbahrii TaxID=622444 RepID=A0ABN8D1D3_9STRA|nr:unnamed protein product [Peronospora belbahrii]
MDISTERNPIVTDNITLAHAHSVSTKRKRVVLSIHDKQQVLQLLESGEQPIAIAREFGISRQQVSDIKKNKERILAFCTNAKCISKLKCKTIKSVPEHHPGVEQELYRWIIRQRTLGRKVSAGALTAKMVDLFMQYASDTSKIPFAAMTKWLKQFKKVYGLKVLSEDEMQQLPEQFVPAMGMTQTQLDRKVATSMDTNVCMNVMSHGNPRHVQIGAPLTSLQTVVDTVQELNTQFAQFEHKMAIKLDHIDERVTRLCYFVLPSAKSS